MGTDEPGQTAIGVAGGEEEPAADALLDGLLARAGAPARAFASLAAFWTAHGARPDSGLSTLDRAVLGGALADRLGYAFVAGYQAALRRLVPVLDARRLVSLCATETGGVHPRAIETTLTERDGGGWRLNGAKQWASCAGEAPELLVIATTGRDGQGRTVLRAARVGADAEGVELEPLPPTGFVPEVPHARVHFDDVAVEPHNLLAGDAYLELLKPFRTVEDLHVTAATLGYLVRVGLGASWSDGAIEALLTAVASARSLAAASPSSAAVHLAVAGLLADVGRLLERVEATGEWETVEAPVRERWRRDAPLLGVAGSVRERRRVAAWRRAGLER